MGFGYFLVLKNDYILHIWSSLLANLNIYNFLGGSLNRFASSKHSPLT